MITIVYGTTGELIKLGPLLQRLQERAAPTLRLCTGQQIKQIPPLLADLGLAESEVWLARGAGGRDLEHMRDLLPWLGQVLSTLARNWRDLRRHITAGPSRSLLIVHGDTMTTVLGAVIGRLMGVPVAHIEAGMRSGDWRNPFPEELDRLLASRLARIHLAPGAHAVANLHAMKARGEIIDTHGNTIRDALAAVPPMPSAEIPAKPFGLASLHRAELLSRPAALKGILEALREGSRRMPILFIDHPVTAAAISGAQLDSLFDERFRRVPRQRYYRFISLLKASSFLVTDSGGSQEECAQLGHPCLVHRAVTERPDGLDGGPVVLSGMSLTAVRCFLEDPLAYTRAPSQDSSFPTEEILRYLERQGFLGAGADGSTSPRSTDVDGAPYREKAKPAASSTLSRITPQSN